LIIKRFAPHKINGKVIEFRLPVTFGATYEIKRAPWFEDDGKFVITELMQADNSVAGEDGAAPIVATLSERKKFDSAGVTVNGGKLLVIGSGDFISNGKFKILGNRVFWFGVSDYMVDGDKFENFEDVKIANHRLALTKNEFERILCRISLLPIGFVLLALLVAFRRRK
jgi:hypothetical protein